MHGKYLNRMPASTANLHVRQGSHHGRETLKHSDDIFAKIKSTAPGFGFGGFSTTKRQYTAQHVQHCITEIHG
jgi:hypothetical protein